MYLRPYASVGAVLTVLPRVTGNPPFPDMETEFLYAPNTARNACYGPPPRSPGPYLRAPNPPHHGVPSRPWWSSASKSPWVPHTPARISWAYAYIYLLSTARNGRQGPCEHSQRGPVLLWGPLCRSLDPILAPHRSPIHNGAREPKIPYLRYLGGIRACSV